MLDELQAGLDPNVGHETTGRDGGGAGDDARAQMIAVVAGLSDDVVKNEYRGCGRIKTVAEYPQAADGTHQRAAAAKSWGRQRFGDLATEFAAQSGRRIDPDALADELTLVLDGVHATAMTLGGHGPAQRAARLAECIIDTAPEAGAGPLVAATTSSGSPTGCRTLRSHLR